MRGRRQVKEGIIISNKMDKTVVVASTNLKRHPIYGKVIRQTSKFKAHDEENTCLIGDKVEIVQTRPLSRTKRWRVVRILKKAKIAEKPIEIDEDIKGPETDDSKL